MWHYKQKKEFMKTLEGKYKGGQYVVASDNPTRRLVVRRYVDRVYYCRDESTPDEKDLVYFERELSSVA